MVLNWFGIISRMYIKTHTLIILIIGEGLIKIIEFKGNKWFLIELYKWDYSPSMVSIRVRLV